MNAEPLPQPQPRQDWMRQHIQALFWKAIDLGAPTLRFEIRALHPITKVNGKALVNARTFELSEEGINKGVAWACQLNEREGFNVYVGANPRKPGAPEFSASGESDVFPFFAWCFTDADKPAAVEALRNNAGPLHKMLVATGLTPTMRVHCYWELEEPIQNPAAWSHVQRHLARAFGTDAVHDTPRILRLGGSISYPSEAKAAKGYRVEIVQVQLYDDRDAFSPNDLLAIPAPEEPKAPASGLNLAQPGLDALSMVTAIRARENLHNNTRDLIAHCVGIGLPDWIIQTYCEEILRDRSDGGTLAEVPALIQSARQKFNKPNPTPEPVTLPPPLPNEGPKRATGYLGQPPERQWIVENWIVQGAVNSLYGDGGVGKTLLAQQIATCVATGAPFLNIPTKRMPVLAVLCEDDEDELHRRQFALTNALKLGYNPHLADAFLWSRVGADNFLLAYAAGRPMLTPFYAQVLDYLQGLGTQHKLLVLDTLADLFGGNEIERVQANYFVKTTLGSICLRTNTTVLLLAHPSRAGMATGDMLSGSTAWHNAVRSRMALQWVKQDDGQPDPDMQDKRLLTRPKANYAQANAEILIEYREGAFFPLVQHKSMAEEMGLRQTVADEIRKQAERGTPLSYYRKASNAFHRHRFMRYGKRLLPSDVAKIVDSLIDEKKVTLYMGKTKPNGLYPAEPTD